MSRNDVLEVIECARHYIREQSKKESKEQVEKEQLKEQLFYKICCRRGDAISRETRIKQWKELCDRIDKGEKIYGIY